MMSVEEQLAKVRTAAVAYAANDMAALVVTGGDRQSWLNGLVTCELATLKAGQAAYGLAVTQKGRILSDLIVLLEADAAIVIVPASVAEEVRGSFERHLIMEDAEIAPETRGSDVVFVHGPKAARVLEAARESGARGALLDRTGLGGAVIAAQKGDAKVEAAIAAAIAEVGGAFGDDAGWEALRVARAIPRFGADFDGATYPQEAGLEKTAVSFAKGCYLGQEVVCMLEMRGHVKRRLVPIALDAGAVVARGADVVDASGQKVGEVTSTAGAKALAMVKRALTAAGTELTVGGARAKVVDPEV